MCEPRRVRDNATKRAPGFRPDIEGLRAYAVGFVLLDHIVAWPHGGFVGVDVFFVVSGFLITGLLLTEYERRGRISFRGFYARRARRILPAAVTVLIAIWVAAHLVFRGSRISQTVSDIWWALGFSANIHFAYIGTDYFQANRPPSLVQHFWSLAVEEQFYLIWPLVMVLVLVIIGRSLTASRRLSLLLAVVSAGSVASFSWALEQTAVSPAAAYFATPVRAWELGVGAIVAVALARFRRLREGFGRASGPLSSLGLAGIFVGAFVVSASGEFPAPAAALPVLAAALVIVAGVAGDLGRWGTPLTNSAARYLGRISYSLYLWHWPVIVVGQALIPQRSLAYYAMIVTATFGLSIASYRFVETPLRRFSFTRSEIKPETKPITKPDIKPRFRRWEWAGPRGATALACCALLTVAVVSYLHKPAPPAPASQSADASVATSTGSEPVDATVAMPSPVLSAAITKSLSVKSFPSLTPPLDTLDASEAAKEWSGCRGATEPNLAGCTFGDKNAPKDKTIVVIGDSYAIAWLPMIKAALLARHWLIYGLTMEECTAATISVNNDETPPKALTACDTRHDWVLGETAKLDPGTVILASTDATLDRLADRASESVAAPQYEAGLVKTIQALDPGRTRTVITLSAPPNAISLQTCATKQATPADCVGQLSNRWHLAASAEEAASQQTHTIFINTSRWFCAANGLCPQFVATTVVRWDGSHLTAVYAAQLGPEFAAAIAKVGVSV